MTAFLEHELGPIAIWHCCRDWPVYTLWPVRRCGECGERPTPGPKVAT